MAVIRHVLQLERSAALPAVRLELSEKGEWSAEKWQPFIRTKIALCVMLDGYRLCTHLYYRVLLLFARRTQYSGQFEYFCLYLYSSNARSDGVSNSFDSEGSRRYAEATLWKPYCKCHRSFQHPKRLSVKHSAVWPICTARQGSIAFGGSLTLSIGNFECFSMLTTAGCE